jgi:hypothetical protein
MRRGPSPLSDESTGKCTEAVGPITRPAETVPTAVAGPARHASVDNVKVALVTLVIVV